MSFPKNNNAFNFINILFLSPNFKEVYKKNEINHNCRIILMQY